MLETLREALVLLRDAWPGGDENALNRELQQCLVAAHWSRAQRGLEACDSVPAYEARNPPTPRTTGSPSERKIPDFQWSIFDHTAPEPAAAARFFHIECKRLGRPTTKAGRKFNKNYVTKGICRFVDPGSRYGKDAPSGAMVGYVEAMAPEDILAEVNDEAAEAGVNELTKSPSTLDNLHELEHELTRTFPISPFQLHHLWIEPEEKTTP